jgi:signal transduction histidine kinase
VPFDADPRVDAYIDALPDWLAEALTNVTKCAQAFVASVWVVREKGHALVEIVDDGIGSSLEPGQRTPGTRRSVETFDGRLDLYSPPGAGTRIRADSLRRGGESRG